MKRKINFLLDQVESLSKRLKREQDRRYHDKLKHRREVLKLKHVIKNLEKSKHLQEEETKKLMAKFGTVPAAILSRASTCMKGKPSKQQFPPVIRSFAITLQYYSTAAYEYVRKVFQLNLPTIQCIRGWYGNLNCDPGFTSEAFDVLESKAKDGKLDVCLTVDEMAIKKQICWSPKGWVGYEDLGDGLLPETELKKRRLAKDAFVFMVINLKQRWKITVGYFLIASLTGKEKANLIRVCLEKLYDIGVVARVVTADGPSANLKMFEELGAILDIDWMRPWFQHPSSHTIRVCVLLDPCHMIKLLRNVLGDYPFLLDENNKKICWKYVEELYKLQKEEGLRCGNRLKKKHIQWRKMKMKVNLATQIFSKSVADSMEICRDQLELKEFAESDATVRFFRIVNDWFDLCNSRNPFAEGYKASLQPKNKDEWLNFLHSAYDYFVQIKDHNGNPLHEGQRHTPIRGILCSMHVMIVLHEDLVENGSFNWINMYQSSQDHVELYFGAMRSRFGANNNPNVAQFKSGYKRLMVRHEINGKNGNCLAVDTTRMLTVSCGQKKSTEFLDPFDKSFLKKFDLEERAPMVADHDYCDAPIISKLSEFKKVTVTYISGYVIRMVMKTLQCETCKAALKGDCTDLGSLSSPALLQKKNRGGLTIPSPSVEAVCQETELVFTQILATTHSELPEAPKLQMSIAHTVLKNITGKNH